jgi:hypothetical protein
MSTRVFDSIARATRTGVHANISALERALEGGIYRKERKR